MAIAHNTAVHYKRCPAGFLAFFRSGFLDREHLRLCAQQLSPSFLMFYYFLHAIFMFLTQETQRGRGKKEMPLRTDGVNNLLIFASSFICWANTNIEGTSSVPCFQVHAVLCLQFGMNNRVIYFS